MPALFDVAFGTVLLPSNVFDADLLIIVETTARNLVCHGNPTSIKALLFGTRESSSDRSCVYKEFPPALPAFYLQSSL
jgi:hypothetical protein